MGMSSQRGPVGFPQGSCERAIQNPNQPSKKVGRIAWVETPQFKYNFKHNRDKEAPSEMDEMGCS